MILLSRRKHHAIIRNGLVGLWLSGPESGVDASGYGRDGTISGSPAWTDLHGRRAINFDGSDDLVSDCGSVSDFAFIHTTGVFSIAFNANWYADGVRYMFGSTPTSVEKGFICGRDYYADLGYNSMRIAVTGGTANKYILTGATADNTALAGSNDRYCFVANKASNDYGQWYKNGIALTTTIRVISGTDAMAVATGDASRRLRIGAVAYSSVILQQRGPMNMVRIYNRAITAAEAIAITTGVG